MEYIANFTDPAVLAQATSFRDGPMFDAKGTRSLVEHVVGRLDNLKIEVFSREHHLLILESPTMGKRPTT